MGLFDFRERFYKPKDRAEEKEEAEKSKPQSHYSARRRSSSSSSSSEDGETTLNAAQSRERDAATAAPPLSGTELSNTQSAETNVEIFGPDYDLPRMRGFHLWGR